MLDRLEKKFGRFAVENLTLYIVIGQVIFFLLGIARPHVAERMLLVPSRVLEGEIWRLLVFPFTPPMLNPSSPFYGVGVLLFAVELYVLYLMGSALERQWGAFRLNVYYLLGYLFAVAAACLIPGQVASTAFWYGSIFLAFAFLFPDFQFLLFFIIPVKVKWLATIMWIFYGIGFLAGGWMVRALIVASVANFFCFFTLPLYRKLRGKHREVRRRQEADREAATPFHVCSTCGATDKTHPHTDFRYLRREDGPAACYCENCLPTQTKPG